MTDQPPLTTADHIARAKDALAGGQDAEWAIAHALTAIAELMATNMTNVILDAASAGAGATAQALGTLLNVVLPTASNPDVKPEPPQVNTIDIDDLERRQPIVVLTEQQIERAGLFLRNFTHDAFGERLGLGYSEQVARLLIHAANGGEIERPQPSFVIAACVRGCGRPVIARGEHCGIRNCTEVPR